MKASVWNWERLDYDYFDVPGKRNIGGWSSSRLRGMGLRSAPKATDGIGIDIEMALPVLPAGAVHTGRGVQAVGTVMRRAPAPQHSLASRTAAVQGAPGLSGLLQEGIGGCTSRCSSRHPNDAGLYDACLEECSAWLEDGHQLAKVSAGIMLGAATIGVGLGWGLSALLRRRR